MATLTVDDLRDYIDRLSGQYARRPSVNLIAGVLEQKRRYRDFHGIDIEVRCDEGLQLSDWVAGEAYQIVCEALSNVFRHTQAKQTFVSLSAQAGALQIEVGNAAASAGTPPFLPRSINERALSLGGSVDVLLANGEHDLVRVRIPLSTRARQP
jgi:signal transduction histidine kinase